MLDKCPLCDKEYTDGDIIVQNMSSERLNITFPSITLYTCQNLTCDTKQSTLTEESLLKKKSEKENKAVKE